MKEFVVKSTFSANFPFTAYILSLSCNSKPIKMKKVIVAVLSLILVAAVFSSCGSSRKTGCPMNERIIH